MTTENSQSAPSPTPVALVSGANRGIGQQVAVGLAAHGFTVLVGSRDLESGRQAAAAIEGEAAPIQLDVADADSIAAAATTISRDFGRLDVLVNNAGVSFIGDPDTPLLERGRVGMLTNAPLDMVRQVFEVNVFGPIALTQALLPLLRTTEGARIVNVGSGAGSLTMNADPHNSHRRMYGLYPVSKTAFNAVSLAFSAALESEGIAVNTVDPGFTSTALNGFAGTQTVEQGAARTIEVALDSAGTTGTFTSTEGTVPW